MSAVKEMLESSLQILRENGWIQGAYGDDAGHYCSMGAMNQAFTDEVTFKTWREAEDAVEKVICEQYPDRLGNLNEYNNELCAIASFNDDKKTTFEDVEAVFEKAIVAVDEHVSV